MGAVRGANPGLEAGALESSLGTFLCQLRRLDTELARRDLADVPTPRLQNMAEQLRRRIERECGTLQFSAGIELSRDDETRPAIQDWKP